MSTQPGKHSCSSRAIKSQAAAPKSTGTGPILATVLAVLVLLLAALPANPTAQ